MTCTGSPLRSERGQHRSVGGQRDASRCKESDSGGGREAPAQLVRRLTGWRRIVWLLLAAVFFCLAMLGVVLPGIPTTPFLLLTSYSLVRSSPRLNELLLRSKMFGPILVDWHVHGGVRTHVRYKAIAVVVLAVMASIYMAGLSVAASAATIGFAVMGVLVILRLPAAKNP